MYKLIASDLDNTLLVDQRIRGKNKEILQKLQAKGVEIVLASGRVRDSIKYIGQEAGLRVHVAASNGAYAAPYGKEAILKETVPHDILKRCLEIGKKYDIYYHFYDDIGLVNDRLLPNYDYLMTEKVGGGNRFQCGIHYFPDPLEYLDKFNCYKFQWVVEEGDSRLNDIVSEIEAIKGVETTSSGPGLLELMAKGVDKWKAVKAIADELGIKENEIICCGDYNNDIKMIQSAGLGIAPENANVEVKQAADMVAGPCKEYGIGKLLEKLDSEGAFE